MIRSSHIRLKIAALSFLVLAGAARADELTIGEPIPVYSVESDSRAQNFESLHRESTASTDQIRTILDLESRATTVTDAIRIKSQGLAYVRDIHDFEYLTTAPFSSPTQAYKEALGDFIASNLGTWMRSPEDLQQLARLETRVGTVTQTTRVKSVALGAAHDLQDFELITRDPFSSSTEEYKVASSTFIRNNIGSFVRRGDAMETILVIEARCRTIDDTMRVKEAGLQAVTSIQTYQHLVASAFSNPNQGYTDRRKEFLARNIAWGIDQDSDIDVILALESQCATVDDTIRVKTAGLTAVQNLEEFLHLTRYAFSNPTAAYREAVSRFIANYGGRYGA